VIGMGGVGADAGSEPGVQPASARAAATITSCRIPPTGVTP
jgi:hypothetical protein